MTSANPPAIAVTGLRKSYEDNVVLDGIDLHVAEGNDLLPARPGMARRLDLAMTVVGDPRIIFLDEPTTGLDPCSRRTMHQIVRELAVGGVTIFLTTQYLEQANQLADRIAPFSTTDG